MNFVSKVVPDWSKMKKKVTVVDVVIIYIFKVDFRETFLFMFVVDSNSDQGFKTEIEMLMREICVGFLLQLHFRGIVVANAFQWKSTAERKSFFQKVDQRNFIEQWRKKIEILWENN